MRRMLLDKDERGCKYKKVDGICFQAEGGIRGAQESRELGDVYKRLMHEFFSVIKVFAQRMVPV